MAKLTLTDLASLANETSAIATMNANDALVETAMENTLSRDGTSPNAMSADLDMDSNQILNLPAASSSTEPVRKAEFDAQIAAGVAGISGGDVVGPVSSVDRGLAFFSSTSGKILMESGYQKDTNNVLHRTENDEYAGISGGTDGDTGGNVIVYGGAHATKAGDIELRSTTTVTAHWDESQNYWIFGASGVDSNLVNTDNAQLMSLSGGTDVDTGANIKLYGSTHATKADDIELRADTTVVAHWDDSGNAWVFGSTGVNSNLVNSDDTALFTWSGGDTGSKGGNIQLYGSTHATNANDIFFRENTNTILFWDDSANVWDFNAQNVQDIGTLEVDSDTTLGGEVEVTAASGITFGSSGPTITSGTGVPATTEPDGSIFLRTDGAAGSTVYFREGGAWNVA